MKIIVYAICKNEEQFVDRWVESMSEADAIYVADTGSTDNTVNKLKEKGVIVNEIHLDEWRFDVARNMSLEFVPQDADICVCTDLDEVFNKGWRKLLEDAWQIGKTTRLKYKYTWSFNDDGTRGTTFWIEKIHLRHGFKWIHPVHEVLEYNGELPDTYATEGRIQLDHYPDKTKSRGQYLPLLEKSVEEAPDDDRNMHYLGREYMFYGKWDDCIRTLKKHLEMPSATWKDERSASMRYIARCYIKKNDFTKAINWYYKSIAEAPYLREGYVELAKLSYTIKDYSLCYAMIEEALKIKDRPQTYINEAFCWDYSVYDYGAIAAYKIGAYDKALNLAEKAYEMSPSDERLKNNIIEIKKAIS